MIVQNENSNTVNKAYIEIRCFVMNIINQLTNSYKAWVHSEQGIYYWLFIPALCARQIPSAGRAAAGQEMPSGPLTKRSHWVHDCTHSLGLYNKGIKSASPHGGSVDGALRVQTGKNLAPYPFIAISTGSDNILSDGDNQDLTEEAN